VRVSVAIVLATACIACVSENDPRLKKLDEIDKLQSAAKEVTERLEGITSRLESLELQAQLATTQPYESATFDPSGSRGYSRIDTNSGTFLVSIENVTPYVDGFRVTCNFGNPTTATYNGFKLKAKWGPRYDRRAKNRNYTSWQGSLREKELDLPDHLQSGAWNRVSFVLSPAKADEFGYLELSMVTNTISLRK
jgi:hypothetical protein